MLHDLAQSSLSARQENISRNRIQLSTFLSLVYTHTHTHTHNELLMQATTCKMVSRVRRPKPHNVLVILCKLILYILDY